MALVVKNLPASTGDTRDTGLIPGLGRSPGEGNGNPLQYSCLKNPMGREAWQATVHRVIKSQTWLKRLSMYTLLFSFGFSLGWDIFLHLFTLSLVCPWSWSEPLVGSMCWLFVFSIHSTTLYLWTVQFNPFNLK